MASDKETVGLSRFQQCFIHVLPAFIKFNYVMFYFFNISMHTVRINTISRLNVVFIDGPV